MHVKIFETIENLNAKGMIANPITLKNFFENDGGLKDVGGVEYLIKLNKILFISQTSGGLLKNYS